jgi:transglutaminase-like putative cysteine protease
MAYCRRNSFDPPARAFERGYGFCTQQAHALANLLRRLRIEATVVHAFQNRFPDGSVGGHTWVCVSVDGEQRDIDSIFFAAEAGEVTFTPLSRVRTHTPLFRKVTAWGEAAVNAHRYYRTGKDM